MTFSRSASEADLLDPETIIAVAGFGSRLHPEQRLAPGQVLGGLEPPSIDGVSVGAPNQSPNTPGISRFKVRLASSEGRRSTASYLIRKMYSWRGYMTEGAEPAPNAITLVASDDEHALGTISVGFDSPGGLLVEALYRDEIRQLRATGAKLCEFTKLAVDRNEQSKEVLAIIFHIAYMYARRLHGCTDLVIEVNPRHVRFYERMLGFKQYGSERMCPRVAAPAALLWLSLKHAQEQIVQYGGHREMASRIRSLYPLFFSSDEENGIVRRLRAMG